MWVNIGDKKYSVKKLKFIKGRCFVPVKDGKYSYKDPAWTDPIKAICEVKIYSDKGLLLTLPAAHNSQLTQSLIWKFEEQLKNFGENDELEIKVA